MNGMLESDDEDVPRRVPVADDLDDGQFLGLNLNPDEQTTVCYDDEGQLIESNSEKKAKRAAKKSLAKSVRFSAIPVQKDNSQDSEDEGEDDPEEEDNEEEEEEDDDESEDDSGSDLEFEKSVDGSDEESEEEEDTKQGQAPLVPTEKQKQVMEQARKELPYTIKCPESHAEYAQLISERPLADQMTIIKRLRILYNPKLCPQNAPKLAVSGMFHAVFLTRHLQVVLDAFPDSVGPRAASCSGDTHSVVRYPGVRRSDC
jgi:nucleolar protein 14